MTETPAGGVAEVPLCDRRSLARGSSDVGKKNHVPNDTATEQPTRERQPRSSPPALSARGSVGSKTLPPGESTPATKVTAPEHGAPESMGTPDEQWKSPSEPCATRQAGSCRSKCHELTCFRCASESCGSDGAQKKTRVKNKDSVCKVSASCVACATFARNAAGKGSVMAAPQGVSMAASNA